MRYSGFRVIAEALTGHKGWKPVWRDPDPQAAYDYVIIGGGGHALATASYLAEGTSGGTPRSSGRTIFWTGTSRSTSSA